MIRSMTGYGRKEVGGADGRLTIEIRSLNNRYIDIQLKSPRSLAGMEPRVKKIVQERFSRGRFDIFITRNGTPEKSGNVVVNEALAEQYIRALRELRSRFGLAGDVELATVAGLPDIITLAEAGEDPESLWQILSEGLSQALDELEHMRSAEGAALAADILSRLQAIEGRIEKVRVRAPDLIEIARQRMTETLGRLLKEQPDPVRVAQEIAILAERTDVSEELTRLKSHVSQFRTLVDGPAREGVGRKLDFLIQEMGRETNTIASKSMDAGISLDVVHIKAELEKVREQVQNIE